MTSIAMKVYDLQWFTTYGMDFDAATKSLVDDGVDTVLTQNRIDPLPSSGVDQRAYLAKFSERLSAYDDLRWTQALQHAGLRVLQTTATFFDPTALEVFPDARPVNALGEPDRGFDWYTGVCPTHDGYLSWKISRIRRVMEELKPDGLFLQFTRFPGFWENWTWNPDYAFSDADRWCFCDRCRGLFAVENGINLSEGSLINQARDILTNHAQAWTTWRCAVLERAIERIRHECCLPGTGISLMLNTLPFPSTDFGGLDVRRTIAAQDISRLERTIDRFELMTYLQILNRPVSWLSDTVADARRQLTADASIVCTLQVAPLYVDGIHASRRRKSTVHAEDLRDASSAAIDAGADGLVFYHWTDFLDDEAAGGMKRRVLREISAGTGRSA